MGWRVLIYFTTVIIDMLQGSIPDLASQCKLRSLSNRLQQICMKDFFAS